MIPTSIDGTDITGATIDGTDVQEITVDGQTVFSAVTIPDSIINRWPFDEGSGSTVNDSEGSDNGTINGATWVTGNGGNGDAYLDFDGGGEYVEVPALTMNTPLSVSVWVNPDTVSSDMSFMGNFGGGFISNFEIGISSVGDFEAIVNGTGSTTITASASANLWQMVTMTFAGSTVSLYVDGVLENTNGSASMQNSTEDIGIGAANAGGSNPFEGHIDDPIIFDDELSASEVSDIHTATSGNYP